MKSLRDILRQRTVERRTARALKTALRTQTPGNRPTRGTLRTRRPEVTPDAIAGGLVLGGIVAGLAAALVGYCGYKRIERTERTNDYVHVRKAECER